MWREAGWRVAIAIVVVLAVLAGVGLVRVQRSEDLWGWTSSVGLNTSTFSSARPVSLPVPTTDPRRLWTAIGKAIDDTYALDNRSVTIKKGWRLPVENLRTLKTRWKSFVANSPPWAEFATDYHGRGIVFSGGGHLVRGTYYKETDLRFDDDSRTRSRPGCPQRLL